MKKLITLILCLFICVSIFSACGGDDPADTSSNDSSGNNATSTQPVGSGENTTEEPKSIDSVAVNDWDGHVFKIFYPVLDNAQADFICDNPNGNVLNDQVYARNTMVENLLNINIDCVSQQSGLTYSGILQSQFSAGYSEGDYDAVASTSKAIIKESLKGYTADIMTYDEINLYAPYWEQGFVDSMTINDSLYAILGDYSAHSNLCVSALCFNKNLFSQNSLDEPYNLVRNYEWTIDVLLGLMDGFAVDYDNDGYDWDKDKFALTGWGSSAVYTMFYSTGFTFCKNDGETLSVEYDKELLNDILDINLDVWVKNGVYINYSGSDTEHHMPHDVFSSGRSLFCDVLLFKVGTFFSEMDDDYGILPSPMLNEEQNRYYTYAGYWVPTLVIPKNDINPSRTGNILEALSAAGRDVVIPKMFEIVTKIQNARDEDSADMIDIVISNKVYDPAHWLSLSGYQDLVKSILQEGANTSSGYLKRYHDLAVGELEDYIDAYNSK